MTIENIKQIMDDLDLTKLFPDIHSVVGFVYFLGRFAVMIGPLIMLGLGLHYYLLAPREANHSVGYRFRWGMGSVEAWQFTQRLAGIVWSVLGLLLTITMAILTGPFAKMEPTDMLWRAVVLILWEIGLIAGSCISIDIVVFSRYDAKGKRRTPWRELRKA